MHLSMIFGLPWGLKPAGETGAVILFIVLLLHAKHVPYVQSAGKTDTRQNLRGTDETKKSSIRPIVLGRISRSCKNFQHTANRESLIRRSQTSLVLGLAPVLMKRIWRDWAAGLSLAAACDGSSCV